VSACERYLNAIDELVDGTLGPIRRAELELHLETCDECRALAGDLREIARAARSLDQLQPPQHAWQEIADRLQAHGGAAAPQLSSGRQSRHVNVAWLGLAAALVLAVGASLFVLYPRSAPVVPADHTALQQTGAPAGNAGAEDPVQTVAAELALIEKHLDNASAAIKAVDPATAAELEKNGVVMKQAIAESRKALEADPQNASALASLYALLKQKMQFLQDTIVLMNAMRQGDAAGAAQIVDSGKS
jgi:anti-sigma factor RsiW